MEIDKPESIASQCGKHPGWKWVRLAGYASVGGFVILLMALSQPGSGGRGDPFFTVLAEEEPSASSIQNRLPLAFRMLKTEDGISTHVLELQSSEGLSASPTIGLLMAANGRSGEVISGRMDFLDPSTGQVRAKFKIRQGAILRDNRKLEFVRKASSPGTDPAGPQKVSIKISSRIGPDLAVMAQFSEGEPLSRLLWVPATSRQGKSGVACAWGWREHPWSGAPLSKASLLAHMWGFGAGEGRIIYGLILCAAGAWLLGVLVLPGAPFGRSGGGGSLAAGATLLFLSAGSVFCLIFPPFHAPDEPDHFLAYAGLVHQPDLARDAKLLADAGHFERIKFRTDEKFVTSDTERQETVNWAPHVGAPDPNRSPVAKIIWLFSGNFLSASHAGFALLGLRLVTVLFVALCLGASLAVAATGILPGRLSVLLGAPAILTPAIAFFSMGVSNYPFLIGAYIVQAVAAGLLWAQPMEQEESRRLQIAAGALAGSGLMLGICSSDNGAFAIVFWAVLIPAYWFLRGLRAKNLDREFHCWLAFFSAYFFSMAVVWVLVGALAGSHHVLPAVITARFQDILSATPLANTGTQAFVFFGYAIPLVGLSIALLWLGWRGRGNTWLPAVRNIAAWLLVLGIGFLLATKGARVPDFNSATAPEYVGKVISSFYDGFGPGEPDWLVTQSFWGIFGWLDTPMPEILNNASRWAAGLGLLALVILSLRKSPFSCGKGFLWANLLGIAAMLAVISVAYIHSKYAVNGRYIIAPYLLLLTAAYEGYRRAVILRFPGPEGVLVSSAAICLAAGVVHCVAWTSVLSRYF